jgi:arabinofuranosyltransferase
VITRYKTELLLVCAGIFLLAVLFVSQKVIIGSNGYSALSVPFDDVYIHCRYAANLLAGNGYSFNPPQQVTADTSPLWVLLIAAGGVFTSHLDIVAIILSSLAWLLIGPAVYRVAKYVFEFEERWAIATGVLILLNARLLAMGPSGMETTLAALLTLIAVEMHLRSRMQGKVRVREAIVVGLAIAVRPELYLLAALAALDWIVLLFSKRVSITGVLIFGLTLSAFFAIVLSLPYSIEGKLLYHSSIVQGAQVRTEPDFFYMFRSFAIMLESYWYFALLFFINSYKLWLPKWRARYAVPLLLIVLLPVIQGFISPQYRHFGRYIFPLLPLVALAAGAFLRRTLRSELEYTSDALEKNIRLHGWRIFPADGQFAICIVIGLIILFIGVYRWTLYYAEGSSNINDQHLAIASWVNTNATPSDVIAADDVGAVGFFTKKSIIDLTGLVTPELYPIQTDQRLVWKAARDKGANLFIIYTRLNPTFYQYAKDSLELVKEFRITKRLITSADTVLSIFRVKGMTYATR